MTLLIDGPDVATHNFLFAHGAGAGMEHEFMATLAAGLAARGVRVVRFEFPYMAARRSGGKKRPPDRMPRLLNAFAEALAALPADSVRVIGGKSMGGRVASLLATDPAMAGLVDGVICLGFPFHPPGKPERLRGEHLAEIKTPTMVLQGERDPFGRREEVASYPLSDAVQCGYVADGDHSFVPRKRSGHTLAGNLDWAVVEMARFITALGR